MKSPSARGPVFVDSTGRRRRTLRRAGVLLAVPAFGYLVLMASSLFGGPRLDTPLVPLPEAVVRPGHRPPVKPGPAAVQTLAPAPTPSRTTGPTGTPSPTPASSPALSPVTTTPSATPTVVPTTPTTGSPTTPPGKPTTAPHGTKPTAPPGRTKSPAKP